MNKYDVILNNDTVKLILADRFHISEGRVVYFYRGNDVVACFDGWIGFTLRDVAEVPMCNPVGGQAQ